MHKRVGRRWAGTAAGMHGDNKVLHVISDTHTALRCVPKLRLPLPSHHPARPAPQASSADLRNAKPTVRMEKPKHVELKTNRCGGDLVNCGCVRCGYATHVNGRKFRSKMRTKRSVWSGSESAYRLPPDRILSLRPTLHATMPLELWTGGFYFSRTRVLGTKRPARPKPTTSRHML